MIIPTYDQLLETDRVSSLVIKSPYSETERMTTDAPIESGLFDSAAISGIVTVGMNGSGSRYGVKIDGPNGVIVVNDGFNDLIGIGNVT